MRGNYSLYNDHPFYGSFAELVVGMSDRYGDAVAITHRPQASDRIPTEVSYRQLCHDVLALAGSFERQGMSGCHCALIGKLSYHWICSYMALQIAGAVAVPLDREWAAEDIRATMLHAGCSYLLCDSDADPRLPTDTCTCIYLSELGRRMTENVSEPCRLAAAADTRRMSVLVFTSGTTGKGKGVMLCQDGILRDVYGGLQTIRAGKRSIATLPPHHTYGSNIGIVALLYAGTNVYLSAGLKYIAREMKEFRPDFMVLVPLFVETFYRRIMTAIADSKKQGAVRVMKGISGALRRVGIDLRRRFFSGILAAFGGELSFIVCGGAPLRGELVREFDAFGISLLNGYGITECSPLIAVNRNRYNTPGSVGVPIPSMDIKIEGDGSGEGEICVRGSNVMLGYFRAPEATAEVMDGDGYFHTGDIGKYENGLLYITGRCKNLIILSNGKNVYPEEIEASISTLPGVSDAVVYEGISRRGSEYNQIVAEIYPDPDFLKNNGITDPYTYFHGEIARYNRSAVKYKQIGLVRVRDTEFPKNTLRKITRFKLDMTID